MISIKTNRLILREYREGDWESVHQYAQQEKILIYEDWGPNSEDQTKEFVRKAVEDSKQIQRKTFELGITLKNTKELIGGCSFRIKKDNINRGDFGYIINPLYWNKGFATEASEGLLAFMISNHGITQIEATCDVLNLASKRVLEKCGMKAKKEFTNAINSKGRIRTSFYFEKIIKSSHLPSR